MQGWWRHYWTDDRLQWSPAEYGNVTEIMVPMQDMWIPDTHVYTKIGGATETLNSVFVAVYSSGDCFVSIPRTITFGCYMQLARFPFDTQICWCVTTMLVAKGPALVCLGSFVCILGGPRSLVACACEARTQSKSACAPSTFTLYREQSESMGH